MMTIIKKSILRGLLPAAAALVCPGWSLGTPITFGEVSIEFREAPTPNSPWQISIIARRLAPTEHGQLEFGDGLRKEVLWEGPVAMGDSIVRQVSIQPHAPGRYHISASYITCPGCEVADNSTTTVAYVLVYPDTVFLAWSSNAENMWDELEYDLRRRGLQGVDPKHLDSLAPDLAERWRKVKGWDEIGPPPNPKKRLQGAPKSSSDLNPTPARFDTMYVTGSGPRQRPPDLHNHGEPVDRDTTRPRRRTRPEPSMTAADSAFQQSEEAARIREITRQFFDTSTQYRQDTVGKESIKPPGARDNLR